MIYMKSLQFIKKYFGEIAFLALIVTCFWLYFVVYMTPSRIAWYNEMVHQITVLLNGLVRLLT